MRLMPVSALSRSSTVVRVAAQGVDLVNEMGLRGARRYWADRTSARRWAPAARRLMYDRIWTDAATAVGATCSKVGADFVLLTRGQAGTVAKFHNVELDDPISLQLALDKVLVHRLLRRAGVTVPVSREFTPSDPAAALALLQEFESPFVIKPASGTRGGSGVTCAVDSLADFHRATLHASRLTERLLIERSVPGQEYRFLFLDGELLGVIERTPPHVVGDGQASVAQLISRENECRASGDMHGMSFLDIDLDCILTLDQSGLTLGSVVPAGRRIKVKSAANENGSRDNRTVDRHSIADAVVDEVRRAVAAVHLRLAGVDVITPDITKPLSEAGGAIIEVNSAPGLHYHYLTDDADRVAHVARPVLETLLQEGAGRWVRSPIDGIGDVGAA